MKRWLKGWFQTRRSALEWAVQCQLLEVEDVGITSDFQAGYVEALCHSWLAAGYPEMPAVETARRMVRAHIIATSSDEAMA
jgi:hypothetical protein